MLNKIIYYSLHNRLVILICSVLLMIGGTYTAIHTDVDVFPDLNAPTVVIMTEANGMAPEEVERIVTFPIETAVNGAMDVRRVRSSALRATACASRCAARKEIRTAPSARRTRRTAGRRLPRRCSLRARFPSPGHRLRKMLCWEAQRTLRSKAR